MAQHVTTYWYVDTDEPAALIRDGATSDPGFARRLLSRLHPTVTVASLGSFPLNRSAAAGPGEIYIGSYPGLTVVQTPLPDPDRPSTADETWLRLVDAPVVLAFSRDAESGVSGFARWEAGRLVRSFSGSADRIVEDEGIPLPFERPYWSGEFPLTGYEDDPLALPFAPGDLMHAAHRDWLGFDLTPDGVDVPVHGFATDGRREIRRGTPPTGPAPHLMAAAGRAEIHAEAERAAGGDAEAPGSPFALDDYERGGAVTRGDARPPAPVETARAVAGLVGRGLRSAARQARASRERRRR